MPKALRYTLMTLIFLAVATVLALAGVLAFGTSARPPELASISNPFRNVDYSSLPPLRKLEVPHASPLAYRVYGGSADRVAVLIHGSSGASSSLHSLAFRLAAEGWRVYAPDMRGHGETAPRGDVDYIGEMDDDVVALLRKVRQENRGASIALAGFSAGGGFVARFAGAGHAALADRHVLMAPALGYGAPTNKPSDPWAAPHVPRIMALIALNRLGIHAFDGLEAVAFAVPPNSEKRQIAGYSYRLVRSFLPSRYADDLRALPRETAVVAGGRDELFEAAKFVALFKELRADIPVEVVPGVDHIGLTMDPAAFPAILNALSGRGGGR